MDTRRPHRSRLYLPLTLALAGPLALGCQPARDTSSEAVAGDRTPVPVAQGAVALAENVAAPDWNTERYAKVDESAFRATGDEPLSTFAVDVDTASYANVRRFIDNGTLPPADAVRIEELVNYFPYAPVPAAPGHPLGVDSEIGPCPWAPDHLLARVRVAAPRLAADVDMRKNLVFLIDVSGSMQAANKLPLLVAALTRLAERLSPADRVGIVVYAGASGVVLEPTSDREAITQALARLSAGGGTNGGAGIRAAYALARASFIDGGVNRVVLATDGDFNIGTTSDGELVRLIEDERRTGVFLTVLGFGDGNYNDAGLERLADRGNGNYFYIDSQAEAEKVLVAEGAANLITIARDVKIQVEMNPREVARYRLIGYENRRLAAADFADDAVDGGEIGPGHTVTALYELVPADRASGSAVPLRYQGERPAASAAASGELFTVKVRYQPPQGGDSSLVEVPVRDVAPSLARTSDDFRFAAGVAAFGMLLRDSEHRGTTTWATVDALVGDALGDDPGDHRAELLDLVEAAEVLTAKRSPADE